MGFNFLPKNLSNFNCDQIAKTDSHNEYIQNNFMAKVTPTVAPSIKDDIALSGERNNKITHATVQKKENTIFIIYVMTLVPKLVMQNFSA